MAHEYSVELCRKLTEQFQAEKLYRPLRVTRYDPGAELSYEVTGVLPAVTCRVGLVVEKFIGGGFAGQVYQVKVRAVETPPVSIDGRREEGRIDGLEVGRRLAMKIMTPPSGFSRRFRQVLYGIGFQGPFQPQVNPAAARAGALWQKFIRRAAALRLGRVNSVVDILATFVDNRLGSCGELSEWVEGRTWRLEANDRLDLLKRWRRGEKLDESKLGSPEYRTKKKFMADLVELLHEMGASELARQYEWTTCKSQPNCLQRADSEADRAGGLVAVDFRAGLALLPFLPMSPGDFKLIAKGIARGSIVQFDRGNLGKLRKFMDAHAEHFADMREAFESLKENERIYRDSVPDITHNHVRLLGSCRLWSTMLAGAVTGWQVRNIVDERCAENLRRRRISTLFFSLLGLVPFLGKLIRRLWGRADYRRHYGTLLTSWDYLLRTLRGKMAENLIEWHRAGRVGAERALYLGRHRFRYVLHFAGLVLPAGLHRFLTDGQFARRKLVYIFVRPLRLYFHAELREQWLRDMVAEGRKNHLVTDEDAGVILGQIKEEYIQKYLKALAVHVCTLPVTQMVSVGLAVGYVLTHPQMSRSQAWAIGLGIIAAFQVVPISPGSLCRGLYVVYLVARERNFKDYHLAVFLGFFKYVGYLAFPIQMAYRYPVLGRFMAAHWATGAVHAVPVFGERGALLEHGVFTLFYNVPLTIRRRMRLRAEARRELKERRGHVGIIALAAAALFALVDVLFRRQGQSPPSLPTIWWLAGAIPLLAGAAVTLAAGGTAWPRRVAQAAFCGTLMGIIYALTHAFMGAGPDPTRLPSAAGVRSLPGFVVLFLWRMVLFAFLAVLGAVITELNLPAPRESKSAAGENDNI